MTRRYPRRTDRSFRARVVFGALAFVALVLPLLAPATLPVAAAAVPVARISGTGYGHGVGLSQHGARHMAQAQGRSAQQIISHFYTGAQIGSATGPVRVVVDNPAASAELSFPSGGRLLSPRSGPQAPGFPIEVPAGGRVWIGHDGSYWVDGAAVQAQGASSATPYAAPANSDGERQGQADCEVGSILGECDGGDPGGDPDGGSGGSLISTTTTTTTAPPPSTTTTSAAPLVPAPSSTTTTAPAPPPAPPEAAPSGPIRSPHPVWAESGSVTEVVSRGRTYRGLLEVGLGEGGLKVVNELDVETYLRGLGELPASWPVAAHGAQIIAARTYALRAMAVNGQICDYDICQVYIGASRENRNQNAAVDQTAGQVVVFEGRLASAVYSSDAGGMTATPEEGFGTANGPHPYLRPVADQNPEPLTWSTDVSLAEIARRFSYPGTVSSVTAAETGPSGRALVIVLDGDAGRQEIDGRTFTDQLALRSTKFQIEITTADAEPAPPAPAEFIQAAPDDAQALTTATDVGEKRLVEQKHAAPAPAAARESSLAGHPATWTAILLLFAGMAVAGRRLGLSVSVPSAGSLRSRVQLPAWLARRPVPAEPPDQPGDPMRLPALRRASEDLPDEWQERDLDGWADELAAAGEVDLDVSSSPTASALAEDARGLDRRHQPGEIDDAAIGDLSAVPETPADDPPVAPPARSARRPASRRVLGADQAPARRPAAPRPARVSVRATQSRPVLRPRAGDD